MNDPLVKDKFDMDYKRAVKEPNDNPMVNLVMCKIIDKDKKNERSESRPDTTKTE
jgi:hypothetical protein